MLRLNASVHSWLTRQERKLQAALIDQELKEASVKVAAENKILVEEKEEAESEQMEVALRQEMEQDEATPLASPDSTTMRITVTDSNGNQLETLSTTSNASTVATSTVAIATTTTNLDKQWDLPSLMNSENEFYKHLKDEVADMYRAWDEASERVNGMISELEESIIAWRLLETGLMEFHAVLGQDRGTLKGLEGALDKGQTTPVELAQNVRLVAKLLSENVHVSPEQLTAVHEHLDPNHMLHIAKFTASNGSLSDSGISDGGATSDGGLSERERRLSALRRLAKKLESSLAPGSNAVKSIAARMESAEADLKNLQNTCRDLIVRTATSHQNMKQQQLEAQQQKITKPNNESTVEQQQQQLEQQINTQQHKCNGHVPNGKQNAQQQNAASKRKNKRKQRPPNGEQNAANKGGTSNKKATEHKTKALALTGAPDSGDPSDDDPALEFDMDSSDDEHNKTPKNSWARRIARAAVPVQLALFTVFCAACLMQPNCCDNLNNFSMSFAPQLRYIRGPPPI
ncbi:uncharacterized protein LOC119687743 [Teleopsis dalmanni]|uniref:uncharacterized protein LOC119687743 n=1 Tax=Teleopsis dalmanni TaxID=139649 RepID=UPI0018CFB34F|nr:uncharacterized protein LOC119687743 [Teleopsis dalmanni]